MNATVKSEGTESEAAQLDKDYSDIINLPHHRSAMRKHMSIGDRAAQFGAFAALTGHSAAISETARLTECKPETDEYEKERIDRVLRMAESDKSLKLCITHFRHDELKNGGKCEKTVVTVRKIDLYARLLISADGQKIALDDILNAEIQ